MKYFKVFENQAKNPYEGAQTSIYCSIHPDLKGGAYYT